MKRPRPVLAAALLAGVLALASCAYTVSLDAAADAESPLCANASVRLPETIGDLERRWTDAQATGAWGVPTAVVCSCGLQPPAPTTLQCVTIGGVDWIVDETDTPNLRLTTYGREPAAQAYIDTTVVSADEVLGVLSTAVQQLPATGECTAPDVETGQQDAPTAVDGDGR
ncbi:DUF3515 family protein [Microbacterium sediminis]|uniref:Uncharacterized protein n=1 Tax=Microbacterium sediminis TaxID=904291 RepID=A0A1B9NHJ0_9MICO|nr:DUF3515 family protein [Microbacterium sediminis]OCG76040.1 hypothetical protein A7J15_12785 [Microbacterium sediminis]QBR73343.1 DUF3515 family protein [Microbacterium sediminis]